MPVNANRAGTKQKRSSPVDLNPKLRIISQGEQDEIQFCRDDSYCETKISGRTPYSNKLKQKTYDDNSYSNRSEQQFESYIDNVVRGKAGNRNDEESQFMERYTPEPVTEISLARQHGDQSKPTPNLHKHLHSNGKGQSPQSSKLKGKISSPKTDQSQAMIFLKEENAQLKREMELLQEQGRIQEDKILHLTFEKEKNLERILTLQGEIESLWLSQQQRISSKSMRSVDSPKHKKSRRVTPSPEMQGEPDLRSLQRINAELSEKLEITYEVNNILKMQLQRLMEQLREYENLKRNGDITDELKTYRQQIKDVENNYRQMLIEYTEREKTLTDQIRILQNVQMQSNSYSWNNREELTLERAKKKIESQKNQKQELKMLLQEAQDQLQDAIVQNQEYRKQIQDLKQQLKTQKQNEASKPSKNSNKHSIANAAKSVIKNQKEQKEQSVQLKHKKTISDASQFDDILSRVTIDEIPEAAKAKNLVGTMIRTITNFKRKVKKIHDEEDKLAGRDQVEQGKKNLDDVLRAFGLDPEDQIEINEPTMTQSQPISASPPIIQIKQSENHQREMEQSNSISNVNLMKMLIELQVLIKEMDPHDYAQYQKAKLTIEQQRKSMIK